MLKEPGQFEFEGKILGLRCLRSDYTSYGGFKNPVNPGEEVSCEDWNPEPVCGGGLHFIPWGLGHDGQEHGNERPVWQVVQPIGDVVTVGGKCKSKALRIIHTGTISECWGLLQPGLIAFTQERAEESERSTGDSSSAASTGCSSSAASTGYSSSAASTGYSSSAASTGYSSSAASTGDSSSAASTGYSSSAASTGYSSSAASTGYRSSAASTGDRSSAASTGDSSSAASTGDRSSAASTGDRSSAASTGDSSSAASTGDSSSAASTGYSSSAASTGYSSSAASTGYSSSAASTGDRSSAASTGDRSSAASTGDCTASVCTSPFGKAKAGKFGCIALAGYFGSGDDRHLEMRTARIGVGDGSDGLLKADVWYSLNDNGEFKEMKGQSC